MTSVRTLSRAATIARARALRRRDTDAEARLWDALRARRLGGWKWKRQVPWGPYFLDFLCIEAGLVVEADGGQHADRGAQDARRTSYLARSGLRVLRFWNTDILTNRDGVCLTILQACGAERAEGPGGAARDAEMRSRPLPTLSLSAARGERR